MKTRTKTIAELKLLPCQSAFAANRSRFRIGLWARQTGKDHTATAEAVMDCYHQPGTTWIIVAASERQGCLTARNLPVARTNASHANFCSEQNETKK